MTNLKKLRLEKHLSQQKLADHFSTSQQAIFSYENGISEPDIYMLKQLATFFNTSIDYLVGHTDCPFTADSITVINGLSPQQLQHLQRYASLSEEMQMHVDAIIKELSDSKK